MFYVVLGGAIAATLDILYAFALFGYRGISPIRILQSIASGILGSASYQGGFATALLGLVLHFAIAVAAAAVFYLAARAMPWLVGHAVFAGLVFGLCVYVVMNFVVLPFSAFPHKSNFTWSAAWPGILVHMFFVGLPIALCVRRALR